MSTEHAADAKDTRIAELEKELAELHKVHDDNVKNQSKRLTEIENQEKEKEKTLALVEEELAELAATR